MGRNNLTGAWGEALAAEYLRKKRYKILAAGYRCRFGEIDLIAANRTYLVFVEVKNRPRGFAGDGMAAVTPAKRRRMAHAALAFLAQREYQGCAARFDVVEITRDGLRHVQDAFRSGE